MTRVILMETVSPPPSAVRPLTPTPSGMSLTSQWPTLAPRKPHSTQVIAVMLEPLASFVMVSVLPELPPQVDAAVTPTWPVRVTVGLSVS